jgi:DNA primase
VTLLDSVLERVNILDEVSQFVKLRRAGRNFLGLCPFHKEKTPSFTVSTEKQIYYCFGCHEGGNAVHFRAKYEHLSFQEALEGMARELGIELRKRSDSKRMPILDALEKLADYYHENLKKSKTARSYLAERGIDDVVQNEFRLGFSDRVTYTQEFSRKLGIPFDLIFSIGLFKMRDKDQAKEIVDVFRGRVVIPILDMNGKVIGFGGRGMEKDVMPKYLNSPESSVFTKRSVLFGIDKARRQIAEQDEAIVVEGYFDLIALHKAGVRNAVASLGTSITEEQVSRLRNYTENITLMLDGDEAGVKSTLRLIGLFGEMGINGKMVVLPEEHDPDSFVRKYGLRGFEELMQTRRPVLDYSFEYHMKRTGMTTIEGKRGFIKAVLPQLESLKDAVTKRLYIQRLAQLTGVEEYRFWDNLKEKGMEVSKPEEGPGGVLERRIVGICMNKPVLMELLKGKEVRQLVADRESNEILGRMLDYYEEHGRLDVKTFISTLEGDELKDAVLSSALEVSEYPETEMEQVILDYCSHAERKRLKEESKRITDRLAEAEKKGDQQTLAELLERKRQVVEVMRSKSVK